MSTAKNLEELVGARYLTRGGLPTASPRTRAWSFESLKGRVVGVEGEGAPLTALMALVKDAQGAGETTVWITGPLSHFYPPDALRSGVDLRALPIVRLPGREEMFKAADCLLRSGGFGFVGLDLASAPAGARISDSMWYRLAGLARANDAALLLVPGPREEFKSSAVSLVVSACAADGAATAGSSNSKGKNGNEDPDVAQSAKSDATPDNSYEFAITAVRDRMGGPGWSSREVCRGPVGMC